MFKTHTINLVITKDSERQDLVDEVDEIIATTRGLTSMVEVAVVLHYKPQEED